MAVLSLSVLLILLVACLDDKVVPVSQHHSSMVQQIQQAKKGDMVVLTNGEIYAVVGVLDSNYVLITYGGDQWYRCWIAYLAEGVQAVIGESSPAAEMAKTAFYNQVVGRTNAPVRLHP